MRARAVICDVYGTLIAPRAPLSADPAEDWRALCGEFLTDSPDVSLAGFDTSCQDLVRQQNARRRAEGVAFPEVRWAEIARAALPGLRRLTDSALDAFLCRHAALQRHCPAVTGAGEALAALRDAGVLLGIASNAQPYTRHELAAAGIPLSLFAPDLCFWSGDHGYSKPDAAVFARLTRSARQRGLGAADLLMVGDRGDNDIRPALAAGWQAWPLRPAAPDGDWPALVRALLAGTDPACGGRISGEAPGS